MMLRSNQPSASANDAPLPTAHLASSRPGFHLLLITLIDFIVRAAYMTGKTPLLPIFAATLGAGEIYLGFISSISALTGMVLKPLIGYLSDRNGRRWWLFVGAIFFVAMPFTYRFVTTPEQLMVIRLIHGIATAIYGPVTIAMVVEMSPKNRAGRIGLFSLGRSGGYIVGPALGGYLLLHTDDPAQVYTLIGLISMFALVPLFYLPETAVQALKAKKHRGSGESFGQQLRSAMQRIIEAPAIWMASGFEAMNYMVTYSAKAFLPLYALAMGRNALESGLFFTVQQGVAMLAKPVCGWLSDRWSYLSMIVVALLGMAAALFMLTFSANTVAFFGAALLLGLTEALIIPSATALLSQQIGDEHIGAGVGIVGTLRNASKVMGPILAGFIIAATSYETTFQLMALVALTLGCAILFKRRWPNIA